MKGYWKKKDTQLVFLLAWIIIPLIFFSLSKSKLILYILPIYPAIGLLAAKLWLGLSEKKHRKWDLIQFIFQMIIIVGLAISPLIDPKIVLSYKFFFILTITASLLISIRVIAMKIVDRMVFTSYLFVMGITVASTYFFTSNPGLMNDQRRIAAYIDQEFADVENILIYDKRMPSMSFLSNKSIISLFDGDESLNREVQFEKDESWKSNLINLKENPGWLRDSLPNSSILMVKRNKLKKLDETGLPFENRHEIDGWILFY